MALSGPILKRLGELKLLSRERIKENRIENRVSNMNITIFLSMFIHISNRCLYQSNIRSASTTKRCMPIKQLFIPASQLFAPTSNCLDIPNNPSYNRHKTVSTYPLTTLKSYVLLFSRFSICSHIENRCSMCFGPGSCQPRICSRQHPCSKRGLCLVYSHQCGRQGW